MDIKSFGGEFKLIDSIKRSPRYHPVIKNIGDDCAVVPHGKEFQVITTDMLVENDHFSLTYFTPRQIGIKSMESSVSDIAAMGGRPLYAFISISLKKDTSVEWVKSLYKGLYASCDTHGFDTNLPGSEVG